MAYDPEYGKHWFLWAIALAILLATFCFPPQRRSGEWKDQDENRVQPSRETLELDRYVFGYLPQFGPISTIGSLEPRPGLGKTTVSTPTAGPYHYTTVRWVVEWPWVVAAIVLASAISVIGLQFALLP